MGHAGNLIVGARSAQSFVVDCLSGGAFHEVRAAQAHERCALDHHESRQTSAGRYAPPAMHGPITAEICGIFRYRRISEL